MGESGVNEKEEMDKQNFVRWFTNSSFDEILKARRANPEKFKRLMDKYRGDIKKGERG